MTIVYVVESGKYSGRYIVGVYDDKELADRAAKVYDAEILEYELNGDADRLRSGITAWSVLLTTEGEVFSAHLEGLDLPSEPMREMANRHWQYQDDGKWVVVDSQIYVLARSEEEAKKIAQDKRAEYLAAKEGVS